MHTAGTNSCATASHEIDFLTAGSTISGDIAITTGTATTIELRVRCNDNSSVVNLLTKSFAHVSGAATTYSFLFTVAEGTNCAIFDLAVVGLPGGNTFTVGTATFVNVVKRETAPEPTSPPQPGVTPPPVTPVNPGSFPYTADCWHGTRTVPAPNRVRCDWWTYDEQTPDYDAPGPFFADMEYRGSPGLITGGLHGNEYKLRNPGGSCSASPGACLGFGMPRGLAIPEGATAVSWGYGIGWGNAAITSTSSGQWLVAIFFYDGFGREVGREFELIGSSGTSPTVFSHEPVNVPEGAASIKIAGGCMTGTACQGFYDGSTSEGRYIRLDNLAMTWMLGELGEDVSPPAGCNALTLPGFTNSCNPSLVIDPNTGEPVCGPLSGNLRSTPPGEGGVRYDGCDKPFLAPVPVPTCVAPTSALDAAGWLAHIACLIGTLPAHLVNLGILVVNSIIDLLFPAYIDDLWRQLQETFGSRAVFAWVEPLALGWQAAWADIGTAPASIGTVTFQGQSVPLGSSLSSAMGHLEPFRDMILGAVAIGFMVKTRNRIMAALNGGSTGEGKG